MSEASQHVVIIGGGASGALLAIGLLQQRAASVTIIEPRSELGRGFAYGEAAPFHLLNVHAANMSAYQDDPGHFLDWLDRNDVAAGVTGEGSFRFVPRRAFGAYLAEQVGALGAFHVRAVAVGLERSEQGGVRVMLTDGRLLEADVAVLASGYALKEPAERSNTLPAWGEFSAAALAGIGHVLILGTGHSALDHVQLLVAARYGGKITMMSRHGFLPAVHRPVEPLPIDRTEIPFGAPFSHVWRWFRERVAVAEQDGQDWRSVLDGIRPHAQALWQSLGNEEQRRFIRHARAWYDVRRHRLAPSIAAALEELRSRDQLDVIAGRVLSIQEAAAGPADVIYRRRGTQEAAMLRVDAIIECTGFELDPRTARSPLLTGILRNGIAQPGPHGFGLRVSASGALIDAAGREADDLYAIGPLTRGQFWEAVGIPDIRQHCARLTQVLQRNRSRLAS